MIFFLFFFFFFHVGHVIYSYDIFVFIDIGDVEALAGTEFLMTEDFELFFFLSYR